MCCFLEGVYGLSPVEPLLRQREGKRPTASGLLISNTVPLVCPSCGGASGCMRWARGFERPKVTSDRHIQLLMAVLDRSVGRIFPDD